jgi:hypothetical protein
MVLRVAPPESGAGLVAKRLAARALRDRLPEPASALSGGQQQIPSMTVCENLMLGAYRRRDRAAIARDFDRTLARLPVADERAAVADARRAVRSRCSDPRLGIPRPRVDACQHDDRRRFALGRESARHLIEQGPNCEASSTSLVMTVAAAIHRCRRPRRCATCATTVVSSCRASRAAIRPSRVVVSPVLSTSRCTGPGPGRGRTTFRFSAQRLSVVWSRAC